MTRQEKIKTKEKLMAWCDKHYIKWGHCGCSQPTESKSISTLDYEQNTHTHRKRVNIPNQK